MFLLRIQSILEFVQSSLEHLIGLSFGQKLSAQSNIELTQLPFPHSIGFLGGQALGLQRFIFARQTLS